MVDVDKDKILADLRKVIERKIAEHPDPDAVRAGLQSMLETYRSPDTEILEKINQFADETESEILMADGFETALIGIGRRFNQYVAVYDRQKCIEILVERDGMSHPDAEEFFEFNVVGGYVGEGTPIFLVELL